MRSPKTASAGARGAFDRVFSSDCVIELYMLCYCLLYRTMCYYAYIVFLSYYTTSNHITIYMIYTIYKQYIYMYIYTSTHIYVYIYIYIHVL